jgi:hypothetical protein
MRAMATTARTPARQARNSGRHASPSISPADRLEGYIGVEHHVGRLPVTARIEIHEQKREVVENIDRG